MDMTILAESHFASENPAEDDSGNKTNSKKQCKRKGKSKARGRSKSTGIASSASGASPAHAKQAPQINKELAKQAVQDLHLSSNGSDSETLDTVDSFAKGGAREDPGVEHPVEPTHNLDGTPVGGALLGPAMVMTTDSLLEKPEVQEQLTWPRVPALNLVIPDSLKGVVPQLPIAVTPLGPDTTTLTLASIAMDQMTPTPPGFEHPTTVTTPTTAPVVSLDRNPDEGSLWAQIGD